MTQGNGSVGGEGLFATLIAVAVDGIVVIDQRGIILIFNAACEKLFGYSRDEAVGRGVSMLMPQSFAADHDAQIARYLATGQKRIIGMGREVVGRRKDGTVFPMHISVGDGVVDGRAIFVALLHDVSAHRMRQRQIATLQHELRQATRLSAMEQLADATAHELNQPLTAALNYAGVALHALKDQDGQQTQWACMTVEKLMEQTVRAGERINSIRSFAQSREAGRAPVQMNEVVADAITFGFDCVVNSTIETELETGLLPVMADRAQLTQVVLNLLLNAADAVAGVAMPTLRVTTRMDGHSAVRVSVIDNGPGVSDDARMNLFQPFVTTKPAAAGMGLSICRSIVEAHGGQLWAARADTGGMMFEFSIPVCHDACR